MVTGRARPKSVSIGSWATKVEEFPNDPGQSRRIPSLKIHFELVGGDEKTPPSSKEKDSFKCVTHSTVLTDRSL